MSRTPILDEIRKNASVISRRNETQAAIDMAAGRTPAPKKNIRTLRTAIGTTMNRFRQG